MRCRCRNDSWRRPTLRLVATLSLIAIAASLPAALSQENEDSSSVSCYTGRDLVAAFLNTTVKVAYIGCSVTMADDDWSNFTSPATVNRSILILGSPALQYWPTIDMGYLSGKMLLTAGASLRFKDVVLARFRSSSSHQAPGLDLIATTPRGDPWTMPILIVENGGMWPRACFPEELMNNSVNSLPRPINNPGIQQGIWRIPQPHCVNSTDSAVPAMQRCWPARGIYIDVSMSGYNLDSTGKGVEAGYNVWLKNATFLCPRVISMECIAALGTIGCWRDEGTWRGAEQQDAAAVAAPPPPPDQGGGGMSGATLGAIVGGCVGGVLLLALLAVTLVLWLRHERRASGATGAAASGKVVCAGSMEDGNTKEDDGSKSRRTTASLSKMDSNIRSGSAGGGDHASRSITVRMLQDGSVARGSAYFNNVLQADRYTDAASSNGAGGPSSPAMASTVVVTAFTPIRPDYRDLDVPGSLELKILPNTLGKGTFGRIVEGVYGGQRVAVKLLTDAFGFEGSDNPHADAFIETFTQEAVVLGRCQHPNVVRLLAANLAPPRVCLVLELMETCLERVLYGKAQPELLPFPMVLKLCIDMASGLEYLHPTIIHRDLKPANVLVNGAFTDQMVAKLSDFGLSRLRSTVLVTQDPEAGTPAYLAPECFQPDNFTITHQADIYGLGVIMWELLTGERPWLGINMVQIAYKVTALHERLSLHDITAERCPPKLRKLILECWDPIAARRPAAAEVVKRLMLIQQIDDNVDRQ